MKVGQRFKSEIFKCIELVNKTPSSVFTTFQVAEPLGLIDEFIANNEQTFNERGWILKQIHYTNGKRDSESDRTLLIQKM